MRDLVFAETLLHESEHFKWYGDPGTISGDISMFYDYMEQCYTKIAGFLGYEPTGYLKIPIHIDPSSQCPGSVGGGTGEGKLSYCAGSWTDNMYCRWILPHELVNLYTGYVTAGWPWADGSPIWHGESPFPFFVALETMRTLNYGSMADNLEATTNPILHGQISMLKEYTNTFGWGAWKRMFAKMVEKKENLTKYTEPTLTHRVFAYMTYGAGLDPIPGIISLLQKYGFTVDQNLLLQMFKDLIGGFKISYAELTLILGGVTLFGGIAFYAYRKRPKAKVEVKTGKVG